VLAPGTVVAQRYHVQGLLGRGGMGHVYRARHLGLDREIALKVLHPEWAQPEMWPRFEREARILGRLDHPGCVRVLDTGTTASGCRYLAMELLDGQSVAAELARAGRFDEGLVLDLGRQVLRALAHAHALGIVHRDLKPGNVMSTRRPGGGRRFVLIDFGLGLLRDDAPLTAAGVAYGSPTYMAPERFLGAPADPRSDVYSAGVMLYELLAGVPPFQRPSVTELARAHLERVALPLRRYASGLSADLEIVLARALSKDPARRFADAEEMLSALEREPPRAFLAAPEPAPEPDADASTAALPRMVDPAPRRLYAWLRWGSWRW